MRKYLIMCDNLITATMTEGGIAQVLCKEWMPFDLWLEEGTEVDTLVNNITNFNYWCATRVLTLDRQYAKEILSSIGAMQGNTDRHWENWGVLIDNRNGDILRLHYLMDFNQAFKAYDTTDGALCQTTLPRHITQKEAAIEAVKEIGLNQIKEIDYSGFGDRISAADMCRSRINILKECLI